MLLNLLEIVGSEVILFSGWTLAVCMIGYLNWRDDVGARRSDKQRALVLQCVLVEAAGFVLLTATAIAGTFLVRVMPY